MISLTKGMKIASVKYDGDEDILYFQDVDDDKIPEIDTTDENKRKIFKEFLNLDRKISETDIKNLLTAYDNGEVETALPSKLSRKYADGCEYVKSSLKKYLNFGKTATCFPIVDKPSYRVAVSGLSGSGKTTFVNDFVKNHKPKKGCGIFLFSPIENDKSLSGLKDLIQVNLVDYEKDEKKPFTLEDMPEGSTAIMDDIDSFPTKELQKRYQEFRDVCLQRGRHRDLSVLTISHSPMQGFKSKAVNMECEYFVLFPSTNKRDTSALLKSYCGYDQDDINEVLNCKSRWCFVKKSIPAYWIGEHSVRLM